MARKIDKSSWHEVIRIASPQFLVTARREARRYETADRKPLAPGYYLAIWPPGTASRQHLCYGKDVRYLGPFNSERQAQALQTSAVAFDLLQSAVPQNRAADASDVRPASRQPGALNTESFTSL